MPATSARPTLALFGFGAFGRLAAQALAAHLPVAVCDPDPQARRAAAALGLTVLPPGQAARRDILLLAVPLPALEGCLRRLAPHLRPGQMVADACSVKEEPARLMRQILPAGVEILATHPMFGPQSTRAGLAGARLVLCPLGGGEGWRRAAAFLRARLRLKVLVSTPAEHDRQAALGQGLVHLLARAMAALGPEPAIRTRSFDLMAEALAMVRDDAPEVFAAVTRGNRHVAPLCDRLIAALREAGGAAAGPAVAGAEPALSAAG